jgi:hypothetical protein
MSEDTCSVRSSKIIYTFLPLSIYRSNQTSWRKLQFLSLVLFSIAKVVLLHKFMPFAIRQPSILIPKGLGRATEGSWHPSCGWCGCHDPAPKKKRLEARSWQSSLDYNNKACCKERASSVVLCRWWLQCEERLLPLWCQYCVVVVQCVAGSYFIWVRSDTGRFCTRATNYNPSQSETSCRLG